MRNRLLVVILLVAYWALLTAVPVQGQILIVPGIEQVLGDLGFDDPPEEPPESAFDVAIAVARERIEIDNFVTRTKFQIWQAAQACGTVAQERAPATFDRLQQEGFNGWRVRTITATNYSHTTVMFTSPDGYWHVFVDNYMGFPQWALMLEESPNEWSVVPGTSVWPLLGAYRFKPAEGSDFFDGIVGGEVKTGSGPTNICGLTPAASAARSSRVIGAIDPNDKAGSQGAGEPRYLSGEEPLRYTVYFENVETATAPAQEVIITDQLDVAKMDLTTLSLGVIAFGDKLVIPPPGLSEFTTDVDLRPDKNFIVRIEASLDPDTGLLTWRFTSIDPATGQLPEDPLVGFLPPNINPPEGEGSVLFSVNPKPGLATGTEIRNRATIVFDVNPPMDTPEWFNTLDNTKPESQVLPLAARQPSTTFTVQWAGTDVGSGIQDYTILVSEDGGPYTAWLRNTQETSGTFTGQPGKTYAFYSVARDQTGNLDDPPLVADTTTRANALPLANAGLDQTVNEGATVTLNGTGSSDPDGDPLAFTWTQLSGPGVTLSGAGTATPSFIAPSVGPAGVVLVFQLIVNDGLGDSAPDTVNITVQNVNQPPIANAGPDQTVDEGATVMLDGRGSSDPDGDPLAFSWTQTAGPSVILSDPTSAAPTFTAPQVEKDIVLTFQLIVNDGQTASNPDTVTITVQNIRRGKRGGSQSSHRVDEATQAVFTQVKTLAWQGQPFTKVVQVQFSLQTFQRLPIGTEVLEPTALTGGRATIQLSSTQDPNIVSVSILSLTLEGNNFVFRPHIQAITGTLDLRTGAFHVSLSFARLRTPETPQPFTWDGTADGFYDFASGMVFLTEVGQGAFLAK